MDWELLRQRLMAAARQDPPSDAVPLAFEQRILARLDRASAADPWAGWNRVLWRAAAPCVALVLMLTVWTWFMADNSGTTLLSELEETVLAPLDDPLRDAW